MGHAPSSQFVRRLSPEGDYVSFCRHCFATVATSRRETGLDDAERGHVCDSYELERLDEVRRAHKLPVESEHGDSEAPPRSIAK